MSTNNRTNVPAFISDLNGGVFEQQLAITLSEVAKAVLEHAHKGKGQGTIDIKIKMERIGNTMQFKIPVTLSYSHPNAVEGKRTETASSTSLMYFGKSGFTLFPEDQAQMFTKNGEVAV